MVGGWFLPGTAVWRPGRPGLVWGGTFGRSHGPGRGAGGRRYAGQQYLGFQRLTLVPIQAKLIGASLLSAEEAAWVDGYHQEVWEAVSPRMQDQPELLAWLRHNTRPLKEQLMAAA
ncbi:hypothetical protein HYH02_014849 [Chlamydomonas schloesseri]|uniref:Peptidase M24 C-terminal domain-containing protein n=1 Tax=Chlamydomonas schloesseri TaxID=2026947 RepID=A0A835VUN6_9CHLO|nr:hypothetical protein HYH02_014849 [Chlamydomonas schloesseri]|eukprot:KAG2426134.1 hypothetical protein HYH02_014849 [Chlamydomonas schloesseri]